MFDHYQAEITVMQFTGHSLLVHQSMSVSWDFYLIPFFQPRPPTRFLLITVIGTCHFFPVHHFGMACLAGSKVNIQHMALAKTTQESLYLIQLLNGMDPQQRYEPAKILGDNQGAIALSKDPVNRDVNLST